jgi:phenylpyruvate tautomerase PptA (4-oxalocrotonate tautomerase family)
VFNENQCPPSALAFTASESKKGAIMPVVTISILEGNSIGFKNGIHSVIHSALVNVFKIPESDYNQRIIEYNKDNWRIPDGKTDRFVSIEMFVFPGRKRETKKKLYEEIILNLEKIGINRNDTFILLIEQPLHNWGLRGGIPADEINFGYKTNI